MLTSQASPPVHQGEVQVSHVEGTSTPTLLTKHSLPGLPGLNHTCPPVPLQPRDSSPSSLCYSWIFCPGLESSRLCWKHGETLSEDLSFSRILCILLCSAMGRRKLVPTSAGPSTCL